MNQKKRIGIFALTFRTILLIALSTGSFSCFLCSAQTDYLTRFSFNDRSSSQIENMYVRGLAYLKKNQKQDGSFESGEAGHSSTPATSGFCLMAALAHGDDPNMGPYSSMIKKSINFILKSQNTNNGYIGDTMYSHGFATLALSEAYGMVRDDRIGPALEKAVSLILSAQKNNQFNAWRYNPDSIDADSSVVGCQLVALLAARNAGIGVPDKAIEDGLKYMKSCQTKEGGYSYTEQNYNNPRVTLSSIGSLIIALNKQKDEPEYKKVSEYLGKNINYKENTYPFYLEYYMSQAIFHDDINSWDTWNSRNIRWMKSLQAPDGSWSYQSEPAYCTSLALLSLALNYRFLPIYER